MKLRFFKSEREAFILNEVESILAVTGLTMEDFTEVDSYGKPLQETA